MAEESHLEHVTMVTADPPASAKGCKGCRSYIKNRSHDCSHCSCCSYWLLTECQEEAGVLINALYSLDALRTHGDRRDFRKIPRILQEQYDLILTTAILGKLLRCFFFFFTVL